ncbi:hypothetical protein F5148DRAFT_184132 [Russula earlei]|uniref:Uncharacterized protein n=1 Tax=Russula earlei TaxID=71964 RepID=A0ACC0UJQ1_9AGAM|nr:hypothetical protein F5148DRAFT_184132 [Russula earlei]
MLVDGPNFQATNEEPEEEGGTLRQNYYLHVPLDHPDSHRWRTEIAKYLAPLMLGAMMGRSPWTLADFPQGYALLLHKSRYRTQPSQPRRDFYLYGPTDVTRFASPLEFVRHAEWLMRGAHRTLDVHRSPRCSCKYCDSDGASNKQSVISRELRRLRARVLARLDGDDLAGAEDEDAGADADADADAEAEAVPAESPTMTVVRTRRSW